MARVWILNKITDDGEYLIDMNTIIVKVYASEKLACDAVLLEIEKVEKKTGPFGIGSTDWETKWIKTKECDLTTWNRERRLDSTKYPGSHPNCYKWADDGGDSFFVRKYEVVCEGEYIKG